MKESRIRKIEESLNKIHTKKDFKYCTADGIPCDKAGIILTGKKLEAWKNRGINIGSVFKFVRPEDRKKP